MTTDVERAVKALSAKKEHYDRLWEYYDGKQPLIYSTKRLREVFKNLDARFTQNWCEVIVNSVLERVMLEQFVLPGNEQAAQALNQWFKASELHIDADDVHMCALVTGEAFVIVWPNHDDQLEAYYNDSRLVHAFYEAENPRQMRYAAKWWLTDDGRARLTLYYPERLEYYVTEGEAKKLEKSTKFVPFAVEPGTDAVVENPLGVIPVFHFRRERRAIASELTPSVLDTQDAINKLFADMMVSGEFAAFKQRYIISNADIGNLKNAPNEIWDIPAGDGLGQDTEVGEFAETQLGNFMGAMKDLAVSLAKMTRTPQSYFFLGARSDPSGEALITMEGPLVKKVRKYIRRFAATWQQLAGFAAQTMGVEVDPLQLKVVFDDPTTTQPLTQSQTRETNVRAGVPLRTQLRGEGWTEMELAQLDADRQAEAAAQQRTLATALLDAQRKFDQEGNGG